MRKYFVFVPLGLIMMLSSVVLAEMLSNRYSSWYQLLFLFLLPSIVILAIGVQDMFEMKPVKMKLVKKRKGAKMRFITHESNPVLLEKGEVRIFLERGEQLKVSAWDNGQVEVKIGKAHETYKSTPIMGEEIILKVV